MKKYNKLCFHALLLPPGSIRLLSECQFAHRERILHDHWRRQWPASLQVVDTLRASVSTLSYSKTIAGRGCSISFTLNSCVMDMQTFLSSIFKA